LLSLALAWLSFLLLGLIDAFVLLLLAVRAEKKCLNSELWHACAGPLVCLPTVGTRVVYFPQGHSEQVSLVLVTLGVPRSRSFVLA